MEEKDVLITITSIQDYDGEVTEPSELITQGKYVFLGSVQKFYYMESELTGLQGTRTAFTVTEGEALMERTGTVSYRMHYQPGKRNDFKYGTPYGDVRMVLIAQKVESHLGEKGGELSIEYELELEKKIFSRNKICMSIKVREERI